MTGPTRRTPRLRRRVVVRGVVQGVGFRPHVYALARSLDLAGAVWNTADGVVVEVEGREEDVAAFCAQVGREAPPLAVVTGVAADDVPLQGGTSFTIRDSEDAAQAMGVRIASYKIAAFAISGSMATVAGLFYGMLYQATPGADQFGRGPHGRAVPGGPPTIGG